MLHDVTGLNLHDPCAIVYPSYTHRRLKQLRSQQYPDIPRDCSQVAHQFPPKDSFCTSKIQQILVIYRSSPRLWRERLHRHVPVANKVPMLVPRSLFMGWRNNTRFGVRGRGSY